MAFVIFNMAISDQDLINVYYDDQYDQRYPINKISYNTQLDVTYKNTGLLSYIFPKIYTEKISLRLNSHENHDEIISQLNNSIDYKIISTTKVHTYNMHVSYIYYDCKCDENDKNCTHYHFHKHQMLFDSPKELTVKELKEKISFELDYVFRIEKVRIINKLHELFDQNILTPM